MASRTRKVSSKHSKSGKRNTRSKNTKRTRKFGLRTKSLTRPGKLDFVTHKGDKVFHRKGHYIKPKPGQPKPYQGVRKNKRNQSKRR